MKRNNHYLEKKKELIEILNENDNRIKSRERITFDRLAGHYNKSLVLFGAGGLGRKILNSLRSLGIEPVAFSDNNSALWGKDVNGVQVLSPQDAAQRFGSTATFVITIWNAEGKHRLYKTREQLQGLKCKRIVSFIPLFWKYPKTFLPYYCIDLPHKIREQENDVRKALTLWEDDDSRREYISQLRWRMQSDFDVLSSPVNYEQYFPDDLYIFFADEVFVDCGAFDGDTISIFLERRGYSFSKIIALEPDPLNFRNLQEYISTLDDRIKEKVTLVEAAVGECKEKVSIDVTGTPSSAIGSGTYAVDCVSLDDLLSDFVPTFIKMDIEGYELKALAGASKVIKQYNPIFAVCVYHRPDHLWRIPLFIKSLADHYHFFLRSHGQEGWDLVCYAVPNNRLNI